MKSIFLLLCVLALVDLGLGTPAQDFRALFGHWFNGNNWNNSPCSGCPYNYSKCYNDRGVIFGYCCGCARVSDFLPIDCPSLNVVCPADFERVCRHYDYMLKCCC